MQFERQSVRLVQTKRGVADLVLLSPSEHLVPLFSGEVDVIGSEPWALHFRLELDKYRQLREICSYTTNRKSRKGSRRAPRWRKDSILVWPPSSDEEQHLELDVAGPLEPGIIGRAFSIASARYQRKFSAGNLATKGLVYIAGCGRSGTTLLQRLMRCFSETHVARGERPFTTFFDLAKRPENHLVAKRDAVAWEYLRWIPSSVRLVYCVRHPYDVLTSFHPGASRRTDFYITPERWLNEYRAIQAYCESAQNAPLFVKYEDLIERPDVIQNVLAERLCMPVQMRFSDRNEELSNRSIRKWAKNPEFSRRIEELSERYGVVLQQFCHEFGYNAEV